MSPCYKFLLSLGLLVLGFVPLAQAGETSFSYSGRLIGADGTPKHGPLHLEIRFFDIDQGGTELIPKRTFTNVPAVEGVFQVRLELDGPATYAIFNSTGPVYVEVKDLTTAGAEVTYPRQRFSAVPYALRVPVDGSTIRFTSSGELEAVFPAPLPPASPTTSGILSQADYAVFAAKQPALGYTPLNKAGDMLGGTLSAGGFKITNLGTPTSALDATPKGYVDANVAGSPVDLSGISQDKILKWTTAGGGKWILDDDQLGTPGGGIVSINGLTVTTQALTVGAAGTAPNWDSSVSPNHQLNLPLASAAGVTAGLLSKADYDAFAAKQNALTTASPLSIKSAKLNDLDASNSVILKAADVTTTDQVYTFPAAGPGANNQVLSAQTDGTLAWTTLTSASVSAVSSSEKGANSGVATLSAGGKLVQDADTLDGLNGSDLLQVGQAASVSNMTFVGDPDTGVFSSAADTMSFKTGGTARMTVAATGNIGIGTTVPSAMLELAGDGDNLLKLSRSTGAGGSNYIVFTDADNPGKSGQVGIRNGGTVFIGATDNFRVEKTDASAALFVDSATGKVGISTATPGATLEIGGPYQSIGGFGSLNTANAYFKINETTAQMYMDGNAIITNAAMQIGTVNSSLLQLGTNNAARLTIAAAGNVGIGTSTPSEALHVNGNVKIENGSWLKWRNIANTADLDVMRVPTDENKLIFGVPTLKGMTNLEGAGPLNFTITGSPSNLMVLNTTGNFGIGTSTTGSRLTVKGVDSTSAGSALNVTNSSDQSLIFARNDGYVGIGTTVPANALDVAGRMSASASGGTIGTFSNTSGSGAVYLAMRNDGASGSHGVLATLNSNPWGVGAAGSFHLGTQVNPANGDYGVIGSANRAGATTAVGGYFTASGATNNYALITNAGFVGMGTTAPATRLHLLAGAGGGSAPSWFGSFGYDPVAIENSDHNFINMISLTNKQGGIIFSDDVRARGQLIYEHTDDSMRVATAGSERLRVSSSGNVGIGTTSPLSRLDVNGQIRAKSGTDSTGAIDWDNGNSITSSFDCGSNVTFANLRDGGAYKLVVTGTGTTQCTFDTAATGADAGTVTYRFKPANAARVSSSHTVYSLQRIGSIVYVAWDSGY